MEPVAAKPVTPRRDVAMFAIPMVVVAIAANVGNALAPTLVNDEPVLLLILATRLRWLLLASPNLAPLAFYAIPLLRATAILSLYYAFGRRFGDAALRWMEERTGRRTMRPVLWIERQFHRGRYVALFFFPGTLAALLAGADRMRYSAFIAIALFATSVRLVLVRTVANAFRGTLIDVLDWVAAHQLWLTVASVVIVMTWVMWSQRHGTAPMESVEDLAEELDEAAAEATAEATAEVPAELPEA